jgi:hypothetical protein
MASAGASLPAPPTPLSHQMRQRRPDPSAGTHSNQIGDTTNDSSESNDTDTGKSTDKGTDTSEIDTNNDSDKGTKKIITKYTYL